MIDNVSYKWKKIFAAKRYNTKDGVIKLTPLEQQEILDDIENVKNLYFFILKKYKKNYIKHHNYSVEDVILCEVCNAVAVDIHHINFKSHQGKDDFHNLIALCRECHNKAHGINGNITREELLKAKKW